MTAQTKALNIAIDYMNERLEDHDCKYQRHPATEAERINILADIETVKEALAQPDNTAKLYEELRSIIDGGSESFTHEDAVQYLKDKLTQPEHDQYDEVFIAYGFPKPEQEPLTWQQLQEIWIATPSEDAWIDRVWEFARAVEAAHGIVEKK